MLPASRTVSGSTRCAPLRAVACANNTTVHNEHLVVGVPGEEALIIVSSGEPGTQEPWLHPESAWDSHGVFVSALGVMTDLHTGRLSRVSSDGVYGLPAFQERRQLFGVSGLRDRVGQPPGTAGASCEGAWYTSLFAASEAFSEFPTA